MEIIIHRVNTILELKDIQLNFGTEIDIRSRGSNLILNHEPFQDGEKLINYLDEYNHGTLILNIKEHGIENEVLKLVKERSQIKSYFLLDVEASYIHIASKNSEKNIAIRFSENESIETVKNFLGYLNWVWIDTNTKLPINKKNKTVLDKFKKVLVCPERWGRANDILEYKHKMSSIKFNLNAVMTSIDQADLWLD